MGMNNANNENRPHVSTFGKKILNWTSTPWGVITVLGIIILCVEILTMSFLGLFPNLEGTYSGFAWNLVDAFILTLVVSPALYFLVFRKVSQDAEKFFKVTEAAQDAIIVMDQNGLITFWNTSAELIFGYSKTEAIGKELHTLVAPTKSLNAFNSNLQSFRETGEGPILGRVREVIAIRKGGEEFPA